MSHFKFCYSYPNAQKSKQPSFSIMAEFLCKSFQKDDQLNFFKLKLKKF